MAKAELKTEREIVSRLENEKAALATEELALAQQLVAAKQTATKLEALLAHTKETALSEALALAAEEKVQPAVAAAVHGVAAVCVFRVKRTVDATVTCFSEGDTTWYLGA
jgi:hypothetical protein